MNAQPESNASSRRRALLALLLILPVPSFGVLAAMVWWTESTVGQVIFGCSKLWIVALPLIWHRFVEKKPCSWSPPRDGGFVPAFATGIPIALLVFGSYLWVNHLGWIDADIVRERAELTGLAKPVLYIAGALYWITFNSIIEEYVWRWFVFRQFERLIGGRAAMVASALGFTLHHVFALGAQFDWRITILGSAGVFTGGLVWSWLYLKYRSVWPCWVSHACVDVPIFVIGWHLIFA